MTDRTTVGRQTTGIHPNWFAAQNEEDDDTARDLDDRLRFRAFMNVLRASSALDRAATEVLSDLDLTAGAFGALLELGDVVPGGLAPSELARRLGVARRTATLYVDILERHGWAARHPHPDDRRMVLAILTPNGERILAEVGDAYARRLARLLSDVSAIQAERLIQLLGMLSAERVLALARESNANDSDSADLAVASGD